MLEDVEIVCPFCAEPIWVTVDLSAGDQRYTEDCSVCCNPMALQVIAPTGPQEPPTVLAEREND